MIVFNRKKVFSSKNVLRNYIESSMVVTKPFCLCSVKVHRTKSGTSGMDEGRIWVPAQGLCYLESRLKQTGKPIEVCWSRTLDF